ncbi:MAG: hypothetical protein PVG30_09100 [Gammaproteobacteria bacterium]|jgi:hypothetical protein
MTAYYSKESSCITQGGILKDFNIYSVDSKGAVIKRNLDYVVIISQACDIIQSLTSSNDNNYLPNIIVLPMYILALFKDGKHLEKNYDIMQNTFGGKKIEKLEKNSECPRYHFLRGDERLELHDTVIDFKHYYTIPIDMVIDQYQTKHIANINPLNSARLSQRFCNYLSRIAIP